ncbi:MAG: DUF3794 domain-containing protein [Ruminococcaceae bacterium]|nr:DUF3794 domain-containing protein [Oscillospiraceae bacterium]
MNVDFKTEQLQINEMRNPQTVTLLVEGDVIVPDVKPDIGEVLFVDAGTTVESRELSGSRLTVSGIAAVHIMYMPEEGSYPKSMEAQFDFADALDIGSAEASLLQVSAQAEHVDFSLIHSRKLHVKLVINITVKHYNNRSVSCLQEVEKASCIKVRRCSHDAYKTVADTVCELTISETLEVPSTKPDIEELIQVAVRAARDECKVMSGKILLKGSLLVNTLYAGDDIEGGMEVMEHELPFTDVVDVPGLDDSCLCHVRYEVKRVQHAIGQDVNGDHRVVILEALLSVGIVAGKTDAICMIDDCYSTEYATTVKREKMAVNELLCEGTSYENIKDIVTVATEHPPVDVVYSVACKPLIKEVQVGQDGLHVKGRLSCSILYGSHQGEKVINRLVHELDFMHHIVVDEAETSDLSECMITDTGISFSINAAGEIELRCVLEFYSRIMRRREIDYVTACEVHEDKKEVKGKGLIIYFARAGETLWDVAKYYHIDGESIKSLNRLCDDYLSAGQKILIPTR